MPFLVTTKRGQHPEMWTTVEDRAVATLAEAAEVIDDALPDEIGPPKICIAIAKQVIALDESGGTVGPLPDGTVIEVEPVAWLTLHSASGLHASVYRRAISADLTATGVVDQGQAQLQILAAYNARQVS